ncbi:hypothetical protein COE51_21510 [Bacillus pseudomycoides]|nr:hypothetical protein COE51_21510 [Bacillus pseudomycoides]
MEIMLFSNQNWDKINKEIQIYLSHKLQNKKFIYVPSKSDCQRKYYNQMKGEIRSWNYQGLNYWL